VANVVRSKILSVRIEPELLAAVKARARRNGRSVSSEIVFLVRSSVEATPARASIKPISGWLRDMDVSEDIDDFREARTQASAKLLESVRRKAQRIA